MITKITSFGYYDKPPKSKDGKKKPPKDVFNKTPKQPPRKPHFPKIDDFRRKKPPFDNWFSKPSDRAKLPFT